MAGNMATLRSITTGKLLIQKYGSTIAVSKPFSVNRPLGADSSMPKLSAGERKEIKEKASLILKRRPIRPVSPYIIFSNKVRPEIAAINPGIKVTEISKVIGSKWRRMSVQDREPYNSKYTPLKETFIKEKEEYERSLTEEDERTLQLLKAVKQQEKEEKKHKEAVKKSEKPKAALSGYSLFAQLHKDDYNKELARKDKSQGFIQQMSKAWASLSEQEKKEYQERALSEADFAKQENSLWVQNMVLSENYDVLKRSDVKKELIRLGRPSMRNTTIAVFVQEQIKNYKDLPGTASAFHKLSNKQKEVYKKKAEKMNEKASKEYEMWKKSMEKEGKGTFVEMAEEFLAQKKPPSSESPSSES